MSVDHVVVVLLDSLNRHMLGSYGGTEFDTPNLDRFAARSVRFTRHYTGSLPCMPARTTSCAARSTSSGSRGDRSRCGRTSITALLRPAGVVTMLASDHPHLFETGGENYHTDFTAWDYVRGHEGDPWRTYPDLTGYGAPVLPARPSRGLERPYDTSRTYFRAEEDFPGPRTMRAAADWLRRRGAPPRQVAALRRRVRPARAVRHARAVGRSVRPGLGRRARHLAALRRERGDRGSPHRARRPPDPRQLRRQAVDDRPLVRSGDHRAGRSGALGRHRDHRVHRPRALPRREGHLGQARRDAVRDARPHAPPRPLAGRPSRHHVWRADDGRRPLRHHRRRLRRHARAPHARPIARAVAHRRGDVDS